MEYQNAFKSQAEWEQNRYKEELKKLIESKDCCSRRFLLLDYEGNITFFSNIISALLHYDIKTRAKSWKVDLHIFSAEEKDCKLTFQIKFWKKLRTIIEGNPV